MRRFRTHSALLLLFIAVLTSICAYVFLDDRPPHGVGKQESTERLPTGKLPLLTSSMSIEDVIPQLKKGMRHEDMLSIFDSIPSVGGWWTTYRLEDGSISLYFSKGTLEDWYIRTE